MAGTETDDRRVAVVTGAGGGLGRAVALRPARDGVRVLVAWIVAAPGDLVLPRVTVTLLDGQDRP